MITQCHARVVLKVFKCIPVNRGPQMWDFLRVGIAYLKQIHFNSESTHRVLIETKLCLLSYRVRLRYRTYLYADHYETVVFP